MADLADVNSQNFTLSIRINDSYYGLLVNEELIDMEFVDCLAYLTVPTFETDSFSLELGQAAEEYDIPIFLTAGVLSID